MELYERWLKIKSRVESGRRPYGDDRFWFNRRKNSFPCELCGEPIQSDAHICTTCADFALKGAKVTLQEQSQEAEKVVVNCYVATSVIPVEEAHWQYDQGHYQTPYYWQIDSAIYELLRAFGVSETKDHRQADKAQKLYQNQEARDNVGRQRGLYFFLTPDQFAALGLLAQAIRSHSAEVARSAYDSGSSVLMRLAQGEVSTSEFDAARQKHGAE